MSEVVRRETVLARAIVPTPKAAWTLANFSVESSHFQSNRIEPDLSTHRVSHRRG